MHPVHTVQSYNGSIVSITSWQPTPCMGSGHILVYAFDVLMEIYREVGYSDRDAALSIVENNLFGMDIISVHISWHILQ